MSEFKLSLKQRTNCGVAQQTQHMLAIVFLDGQDEWNLYLGKQDNHIEHWNAFIIPCNFY